MQELIALLKEQLRRQQEDEEYQEWLKEKQLKKQLQDDGTEI